MEKTDFRTLSESSRLEFRKRAVKLIKSGKKKGEVADIIGIKAGTLSQWWKDYQSFGYKGLESKKKGVRSEDKKLLSDQQEAEVQKMIVDKMPD